MTYQRSKYSPVIYANWYSLMISQPETQSHDEDPNQWKNNPSGHYISRARKGYVQLIARHNSSKSWMLVQNDTEEY